MYRQQSATRSPWMWEKFVPSALLKAALLKGRILGFGASHSGNQFRAHQNTLAAIEHAIAAARA
jgi:hypothetical protein